MRRVVLALVGSILFAAPVQATAQNTEWRRVLVIGAHPDDEDTQITSWLQRGGNAETAYLALTRGDGGQNLIGNELGEALGVIRTEELLAARRVDGAHQYFTRAYDFGFSKSVEETDKHWPRDSLLNDVIKVVRAFRPHIILAIFSGTPRDGHGQHQVSAILAKEAYESSGDTKRFPESQFGKAWTVSKFYRDAWFGFNEATLRINVGEYDPALGRSYAEIAGESRSQHKSQGFGTLQPKGVVWAQVRRDATRVNADTPADKEKSIFDGITVPAPRDVSASKLDTPAQKAVAFEAIADRRYVAVGDSARVTATVYNRWSKPISVFEPGSTAPITVAPDSTYKRTYWVRGAEITQPWWLAAPRNGDLFSPPISTISEDARSNKDNATVLVQAGSQDMVQHSTPVVFRYVDAVKGEVQRPLAVAPAISVTLDNASELARAGKVLDRFYNVTLRSARMKAVPVAVSLALPAGLTADSVSRTITVDSAATRTVTFRVKGKLAAGVHELTARATSEGVTYRSGYMPIEYDHITPERIYRPAELSIHAVDIAVPAKLSVAYVRGVGDNVEPALEQLGIPVTVVDPHAIPTVDLSKFSTVVVGPRAYQASRELIDNNAYLLNFARSGGTLVVQYGQYEMMRPGMMPYEISIARPHDRVTEEDAPIRILDASSSALKSPNAISVADFNAWVQERSLYMPRTFDAHYHPLVELNDPGEQSNKGGILVTPYGRGLYVYTTLAFFRQLPAGVGGAARLFVNLLSMTGDDGSSRTAVGSGR
jgi:LmbE family N-acetylglucosaminyl deacetylase